MEKTKYRVMAKGVLKECISSIKTLVNINSEYDCKTASEINPFGKGVTDALKALYDIAKADGFEAYIYDNMILEINIGDEGKDVTILGHLDVVPATGNWVTPPYEMSQRGGCLYGRGVSDDKGPLMAAYYAAKTLYKNKKMNGYHVRILAGGNEESGSRGVYHYFEELLKPVATIGFTPDASFPCVFAEKAITSFDAKGNIDIPHVFSIRGGVAYNAVIERCEVVTDSEELLSILKALNPNNMLKKNENLYYFTSIGKSAHGSTPELGINAGMNVLKSIYIFNKSDELKKIIDAFEDLHAKGLKSNYHSQYMGECSLNIGYISYTHGEFTLGCNYRYVEGQNDSDVKNTLIENSPLKLDFKGFSPLLYKRLDSPLIKALTEAYKEESGDNETKPLAIGGGTYAKETENIVGFGMEFPGVETRMHDANEFIRLEDLEKGIAIYMNAIEKLGDIIK